MTRVNDREGMAGDTDNRGLCKDLGDTESLYRALIRTLPDAVTISNLKGKIIDVSRRTIEITRARSANDLIGKNALSFIAPEDHERALINLQKTLQNESLRDLAYTLIRVDGTRYKALMNTSVIKDAMGKPVAFIATSRDITEKMEAERALRESEEKFRIIAEQALFGIFILQDFKVKYINQHGAEILGYTVEEIQNWKMKDVLNQIHQDDVQVIKDMILGRKNELKNYLNQYNYRIINKQGKPIWVSSSSKRISYEGKEAELITSVNINEKMKTERKLKESMERYRDLYENALVGLWTINTNDGSFINANEITADLLGINSTEDLLKNTNLSDIFKSEDRKVFIQQLVKYGGITGREFNFIDKQGVERNISVSAKYYKERGIAEGVLTDITELKRTQKALGESNEWFRLVMDNIPQYVFWKNRDSVYMGSNLNFAKVSGVDNPDNIIGKTDHELAWKTFEADSFIEIERLVMELNKPEYHVIETQFQADGKHAWLDTNRIPLHNAKGEIIGLLGTYEDITKRVLAEQEVKKSLIEKMALLKEIHHRVKNNLQIISSLLNLQSRYIKDESALELFKESQNRIRSMALIHEKLYQTENFSGIEFGGYLKSLIKYLFRSYGISSEIINLKLDMHEVFLDMKSAIPCGLITTELISNMLKHAFPNGRKGTISIELFINEKYENVLIIEDDGIGINDTSVLENPKTLGMQLITMLIDQLKGSIDLKESEGTKYIIKILGPNYIP